MRRGELGKAREEKRREERRGDCGTGGKDSESGTEGDREAEKD